MTSFDLWMHKKIITIENVWKPNDYFHSKQTRWSSQKILSSIFDNFDSKKKRTDESGRAILFQTMADISIDILPKR